MVHVTMQRQMTDNHCTAIYNQCSRELNWKKVLAAYTCNRKAIAKELNFCRPFKGPLSPC